jgi:hypothetical protein
MSKNNKTVCSVCLEKSNNIDFHPLTGEKVCICEDCLDDLYEQVSGEDIYLSSEED